MEIRKAQRKKAKLRLGIAAPSGAGKTYSALLMAFGIGGKIGLIDTEHGSGDLYAHLGEYDVISIEAPYTVTKYRQAIQAFEDAGYTTIIIDSLSHAWAGEGGLLDKQGKIADSGKANGYTAWRTITPEHNALVDAILQSKCHVIATMRSKQEYVLETNDKGKQTPKKVGMAPIQRDGMEYEFTVMLDIDVNHVASTSKDRTGLFDGQYFKPTIATGKQLLAWLEQGVESTNEAQKFDVIFAIGTINMVNDISELKNVMRDFLLVTPPEFQQEIKDAGNKRHAVLKRHQELADMKLDMIEKLEQEKALHELTTD
tara:strand:- start:9063 stop:10004 length:942 start_codon:yes stop_codon:yes gene_type:complete